MNELSEANWEFNLTAPHANRVRDGTNQVYGSHLTEVFKGQAG
ncbi:MAG: hypothetical protein ACKO3P_17120 [Planctomycetaceae bacterium]